MRIIKNNVKQSLQLQIDHDGLIIPLEKRLKIIDLSIVVREIIAAVEKYGRLKEARAYAYWNRKRYGNTAEIFKQGGIEPVMIKSQAKNQADIEIIQQIRANIPYFDLLILLTNDDDLLPGIEAVQRAGKETLLMYWPEVVNKRLLTAVAPGLCLSLEDVFGLGPINEPQSGNSFNDKDLRTAIISAELIVRRRIEKWIPYQFLIEAMMPEYTYNEANQLIEKAINSEIFIIDQIDNGKRHIIFINYEKTDVIKTIDWLNKILQLLGEELCKKTICDLHELTDFVAQNSTIKWFGESPYFWIKILQKYRVFRKYTKRIPGSLTLASKIEMNLNYLNSFQNSNSVAIAA